MSINNKENEIKISYDIKDGHIFKNYKDLIKFLGMKEKTGKSKQIQLEKIKKEYFNFKKEGNKFIVTSDVGENGDNKMKDSTSIYSIDLNKLKKVKDGTIFKNYKEMTETLGMRYLKGNSKIEQMNFINENIFQYTQDGRKLQVLQKYSMDEIKESLTMVSEGVTGMIEKMFLSMIVQHYYKSGKGSLVLSKSFFARSVALINMNYKKIYNESKRISEEKQIKEKNLKDFLNRHNGRINYLFKKTAQVLRRKYYIQTDVELYGVFLTKEEEIQHIGKNFRANSSINLFGDPFVDKDERDEYQIGSELTDNDYTSIVPITYDLENEIYQTESTILKGMDCSSDYEAKKKGVYNEFRRKCDVTMANLFGLKFYFKAYRINYHKGIIDDNVNIEQYRLKPEEELVFSKQINDYTKKSTIDNAKKRIEKKKLGFDSKDKDFAHNLEKDFIDYQSMSELYIDNIKDREILKKQCDSKGDG